MHTQTEPCHEPRMIAPPPGFSRRVMARIEERERVEARRRAWIGVALLTVAGSVPVAVLALVLVPSLSGLYAIPDVAVQLLVTLLPYVIALGTLSVELVDQAGIQLLAYALFVLALTYVWARVVSGSPSRQLA